MENQMISYDYNKFKKILFTDPKVLQEYESLEDEFVLIAELLNARKKAHKTQEDLAQIMDTSSSVISRLESISGQKKHSPTIATLKKYAAAVGCKLVIKLVPQNLKGIVTS
jgi:DNA-binding XRE family transcriptional regulator